MAPIPAPTTQPEQATIRCVLLRGGTSKGLYFHAADLPAAGPQRDRLIVRLMGSPDILQIDGLGGSRPITSKVAIIARSQRPDADVDYTFGQVEVEQAEIRYDGNCGNISSGVGPFAIDEGLVEVHEGSTTVRIFNTNTEKVLVAEVPVRNGKAAVEGTFAVPGVPGTGAEIIMNWSATVGSRSGRLLPTRNPVDQLKLESGEAIPFTLCDAGNVCIWAAAHDLGIEGSELSDALNHDRAFIDRTREVRGKVAVLLGACTDWRLVDEQLPGLMLGLVAPPQDYTTLGGTIAAAADMDLRVRLMFMNRLHESIAGTGSICLAAASRVAGSVVHAVAQQRRPDVLLIGHPSGITAARVRTQPTEASPFIRFEHLGFSRTARRLTDCNAYYPRTILQTEPTEENVDQT